MLEKIDFRSMINEERLPRRGSNRSYMPLEVVESFVVGGILGTSRLNHIEMIRHDEVIRRTMGWTSVPSPSTLSRFLAKMDPGHVAAFRVEVFNRWFARLAMPKATLDVDSTVIQRYGSQERATKGYNPTKPGRPSHHPLIAFLSEPDMVANLRLRPGSAHSATDACDFIRESIDLVGAERIGLVSADKGFYSRTILEMILEKGVDFVIAARMTTRLQHEILTVKSWRKDKGMAGVSYGELAYQPTGWPRGYRFVIERRDVDRCEDTGGMLFAPDDLGMTYSYRAYVTSLRIPAEMVVDIYRKRGSAENQIKQLKNDFGLSGYGLQKATACEMMMVLTAMAYNVVSLCIYLACDNRQRPQWRRFVLECIALGSWIRTTLRKTELVVSVKGSNRHLFAERLKILGQITTLIPMKFES